MNKSSLASLRLSQWTGGFSGLPRMLFYFLRVFVPSCLSFIFQFLIY